MEVPGAPGDAPETLLGRFGVAPGVPRGAFWEEFLGREGSNGANGDISEIDIPYSTLAMFSTSQCSQRSTKNGTKEPYSYSYVSI